MAPGLLSDVPLPSCETDETRSDERKNSSSSKTYWETHPHPSLMHRSLHNRPIVVEKASKHTLYLHNGQAILDGCGGAAVSIIGNGNTEVINAITRQASQVPYVHTLAYTTQPAEELADLLVGDRPGGLSKAFFVGSGSEAVDGAMKLARQYFYEKGEKARTHFIARRQGYHGNCFGSMSLSNNVSRLAPYHDVLLPNVSHVSPSFPYRYQKEDESTDSYVDRLACELDEEFQRIGPDKVIAFVAETVGGATSGCITAAPGYFAAVSKVCKRYGALLILDEIMCGLGRTGHLFAWEAEGVVPDIMTIGKALGGGYVPVSGILIHESVVAVLDRGTRAFNHGQTYQAHPLSCAAALAVQTIVKRDGLVKRSAVMGERLGALLQTHFGNEAHVGDIRGRGLFWALEFVEDRDSKRPFDPSMKFGMQVQAQAMEYGVAVYPGFGTVDGTVGDHILFAPAFTISDHELETIVSTVLRAYKAVVQRLV
ncbi:putative Pyridoxal phosphate-dependent transferase, major region, subdomain 2 [Seiridium cardinale]|uniref:Pyridoxal phosphate-dependent transferase, major region, subdomain 2 n=1 Tax=Seiridium cardinale TaxID=138064 RepID=A0ABR2Y277_9PEZI